MPVERTPEPTVVEVVTATDARTIALGLDGMLRSGPADILVRTAFADELSAQLPMLGELSLVDLAHTVALVEGGGIPAAAGARLLAALLALDARPEEIRPDPALGDAYTNREARLLELEPAAAWLGAGRARREATTTAFHIAARRRTTALVEALAETGVALVERSALERDTLMADYTYLQAAQPTTMGHFLLGTAGPIGRDIDRAIALDGRLDRSPAGVGSGNGSLLDQRRSRIAELLGFDRLVEHGRDAIWPADVALEAVAVAAAAAIDLDRLAEDLLVFASEPFGFVALRDDQARASRALPHKRNPFGLTHVRAVANRAIGRQASVTAASRMPTGQPDTRSVAGGEVLGALDEATGAAALMAEIVTTMRVDAERCAAALAASQAAAGDLAAVLIRDGGGQLDVRTAHRLVARLLADLSEDGRRLSGARPSDVTAAGEVLGLSVTISEASLADALDPRRAIAARSGPGGAAAGSMDALLADATETFAVARRWSVARMERAAEVADRLRRRAEELAATA